MVPAASASGGDDVVTDQFVGGRVREGRTRGWGTNATSAPGGEGLVAKQLIRGRPRVSRPRLRMISTAAGAPGVDDIALEVADRRRQGGAPRDQTERIPGRDGIVAEQLVGRRVRESGAGRRGPDAAVTARPEALRSGKRDGRPGQNSQESRDLGRGHCEDVGDVAVLFE